MVAGLACLGGAPALAQTPAVNDLVACGKAQGDEAIAACDRMLKRDPGDAAAHVHRGLAVGRKGDYDAAIADFDAAIKLDPRDATAFNNRGVAYRLKGDYERAIADFDKALSLDPGYGRAAENRDSARAALVVRPGTAAPPPPAGDAAAAAPVGSAGPSADVEQCRNLDNKDLTKRLEACTRAIAASSGNPDVVLSLHRKRMALYAQLGQLDRMVPDCDEVIRLAPDDQESAFAYGLRGLQLVRQHELDRAMADLDKAITLDPSQVNFYWMRGNAHLVREQYPQARVDIDKALSLNPGFLLGYALSGQYHLELDDDAGLLADTNECLRRDPQNASCSALRARYHLRAGSLADAQADADRAVAANPQDAGAYAVRGRIALVQNRTDAAVSDLTQAIEHDPDNQPEPVAYRGAAHERAGNTALATADYRHALELVPSNKMDRDAQAMARQRLAALLLLQAPAAQPAAGPSADLKECRNLNNKDLTQRLEACTRAIASGSGNPDVALPLHRTRMALYAQLGQLDRMMPDCDEVIRLAPDDRSSGVAYGLRGLQLFRRHELDRAIADLDKATMLDPSQFNFYLTRGNAHLAKANYPQARADIDQALSLNPDFVLGYWLRGQYHLELDDAAAALADADEGLRRDPQNAYCLTLRAQYHLRAGNLTDAQADADRAVAANPQYAGAYAVRGRIALAQGRTDAAVSDLTQAIEHDEDKQPEPVAYRGAAHERAGNTGRATADYRHALELVPSNKMDRDAQAMARQRLAALPQAQPSDPGRAGR